MKKFSKFQKLFQNVPNVMKRKSNIEFLEKTHFLDFGFFYLRPRPLKKNIKMKKFSKFQKWSQSVPNVMKRKSNLKFLEKTHFLDFGFFAPQAPPPEKKH